jgi:hypothetical protein
VLAPGDTINFQIHVDPDSVDGTATICVTLYDMDDPEIVLGTVKAMFETSTTGVYDVIHRDL